MMPMPMNSTNTTKQMGMSMDMNMEMVMTFRPWNEYQLKLLFDSWNIEEKWQFGLSIVAVILACIASRGLRRVNTYLHKKYLIIGNKQNKLWLVLYSTSSGINYGLTLMLMLVSMTYNPVLFVSLMIGYGIGEGIFSYNESNHNLVDGDLEDQQLQRQQLTRYQNENECACG